MAESSGWPQRRSIRLQGYDYAQAGAYFVTICTHRRACWLGRVQEDDVCLSTVGTAVLQAWLDLPVRFPSIDLDAFVVMPNHVHGIVVLSGPSMAGPTSIPPKSVGAELALPGSSVRDSVSPPVNRIIQAFKSLSAREGNRLLGRTGHPFWQRNYWEHVVRGDADLDRIRAYIATNPAKWSEDRYYAEGG